MPARFITLEGGEGAGKSTQARRLGDRLVGLGHGVVLTREPGGSALGDKLRELILASRPKAPATEFLLFAAVRTEHLANLVVPALARGDWVVCDRFTDSTRVYQGDLAGIDRRLIAEVEARTVSVRPDLTLMLDLPAEIGRQRAIERGRANRFDEGSLADHDTIRQGFLRIAHDEPGRCAVVDAARGIDDVAADIWRHVTARLAP